MMAPAAGEGWTATVTVMTALLSLLSLVSFTHASSATLLPQSLIVGLNNELMHVFNCTVTGADNPGVFFGDLPFSDQIITDRGIIVSTTVIDADTGSHAATISVPATIENNMTSIECVAVNLSTASVRSPIATFLVQGLLDAPSTRFVPINESYLSFEWEAPFTLDITDVDPDIQFYTFQESLTGTSVNVTEVGDFVFPTVAVTVEFSVSAWNVAGKGATASATHQPCTISEEQQTIVATEVRREVIYQDDLTASLFLSLDWPTACVPLLSVQLMREQEAVTRSRLVPTVTGSGGDRELRLVLPLDGFLENTQYTAQLTSISDEREVAALGIFNYSTHDVQEVRIDFTPTSLTATCQFAVGSLALGCSIHIFDQTGAEVRVVTPMRNPDGQGLPLTLEVTVELESGVYTVRVYDIESDGQTSTDRDPAHMQTVDITQPTSPTSATTPDIGVTVPLNPGGDSSNTVPIIAGAVVGGVLLIAVAIVTLFSVMACFLRHRKQSKSEEGGGEFVYMTPGTTNTSTERTLNSHLSPPYTLPVSMSSSPAHTLPGSNTSLKPGNGTGTLPPTYNELEHKHMRSMSDDVMNGGGVLRGGVGGVGGVFSQESQVHLLTDTDSALGTMEHIRHTSSPKKVLEATLSAPSISPPPTATDTQTPPPGSMVTPQYTSHTHLQRHQRSSSMSGHQPTTSTPHHRPSLPPTHLPQSTPSHRNSSSHPPHSHISLHPPHPPKSSQAKRSPSYSLSTPTILLPPPAIIPPPPSSSSPPPPIPPTTLTYQDIKSLPSGRDAFGEKSQATHNNPLYDTTVALQLRTEEKKRRSIHYTEIHTHTSSSLTPVPTGAGEGHLVPRDREAVMYSELKITELVPRLPSKKSNASANQSLEDLSRAY